MPKPTSLAGVLLSPDKPAPAETSIKHVTVNKKKIMTDTLIHRETQCLIIHVNDLQLESYNLCTSCNRANIL